MTATTDSACVLVIDDEEEEREALRDAVEMEGCSAIVAASAKEGMAILERQKPRLIIVDLRMPGMNGAEMLTLLRHDEVRSALPVLTSTSAPVARARGRRAPAHADRPRRAVQVDPHQLPLRGCVT